MHRLLSVSILALSLATAASAHADEWFRLNMSTPIHFGASGDGGESDLPPDHGQNGGEVPIITASGGMFRALASISIPVLVNSGSGGYALQDDHPDLEIMASGEDGHFTLQGALMSSATVNLNATDMLFTPAEPLAIQLSVLETLVAHGPADLGVVRIGTPMSFDVGVDGAIGGVAWSLSGASNLTIDSTGHVAGTPVAGAHTITAIVVDDFDGAEDATDPISLVVQPNLSVRMSDIVVSTGQIFSEEPAITGRIGDLTWQLAEGSAALPNGVALHPETGQISGQVDAPMSGLQLAVVDAFDNQQATTETFAITVVADTQPDPFSIVSVNGVEPHWDVISVAVSPTGFEGAVPIVAAPGAQVSIDNGPWLVSGTISDGQNFRLKTTAPDQSQTLTTNVSVGSGAPVSWSVTTWTEIVRTISSPTTTADPAALFGATWSNASVRKRLLIPNGVTVSSNDAATAALPIGGALAGSLIIENHGIVAGAGGAGGVAGSVYGKDGGDGISLATSGVKIINKGMIAAGGGGGGMGGKGANGYKTTTLREPVSGEQYLYTTTGPSGNYNWHVFGGSATSTGISVMWNGTFIGSGTNASATSVTIGSYTYYRGTFKTTMSTGSKYAIYRTSSQGQLVTGGTGGNGGTGATHPTTGTVGSSGQISPGGGAGSGGAGGNGGSYGQAGATGNTGGTGTNGSAATGYAGGASGFAIKGAPSPESLLGSRFGS